MSEQPDRLLTVQEVAARLGTSPRYPRYLIETRRIEFVRVGRKVRIRERVIEELIRDGIVPARAGYIDKYLSKESRS